MLSASWIELALSAAAAEDAKENAPQDRLACCLILEPYMPWRQNQDEEDQGDNSL